MAQAVECLPMWEALDLISSTKKKKKKDIICSINDLAGFPQGPKDS
jgi:hypothetical protein